MLWRQRDNNTKTVSCVGCVHVNSRFSFFYYYYVSTTRRMWRKNKKNFNSQMKNRPGIVNEKLSGGQPRYKWTDFSFVFVGATFRWLAKKYFNDCVNYFNLKPTVGKIKTHEILRWIEAKKIKKCQILMFSRVEKLNLSIRNVVKFTFFYAIIFLSRNRYTSSYLLFWHEHSSTARHNNLPRYTMAPSQEIIIFIKGNLFFNRYISPSPSSQVFCMNHCVCVGLCESSPNLFFSKTDFFFHLTRLINAKFQMIWIFIHSLFIAQQNWSFSISQNNFLGPQHTE